MESEKSENDIELTSTMGNVLSGSSKDEKNDTNDATPTSSTDANTRASCSHAVSEDPISSTSSEIEQSQKTVTNITTMEADNTVSLDTDADLLEISMMSHSSSEKITENVDDLVQDLETLLGESTDSFNIPTKSRPTPTEEPVKIPETVSSELEENEETEGKTCQNEDKSKENSEKTPQSVSVSDNVTNEREKDDPEAERAEETSIPIETSTNFEEKHEEEAKSVSQVCEIGVVREVFEKTEPEIGDKKEEEKFEENAVLEENEEKEEPVESSVAVIVNKCEENLESGDVVDNTQNIQEIKEDFPQNINISSEITKNASKTHVTVIEQSPDSASTQETEKIQQEETNSEVSSIVEEQKPTKVEEEEENVQQEVDSQPIIAENTIEENTKTHTPEEIAREEEDTTEAAEECEDKKVEEAMEVDEVEKNEEKPQILEPEDEIPVASEGKEEQEENVQKETSDAILNTTTASSVAEIEETTANEETITDKMKSEEILQEEEEKTPKEDEKTAKEEEVNQITATERPIEDIPPSSDDKIAVKENEEQLKITEVPIDETSIVVEEKEDNLDEKDVSEENEAPLDPVEDIEGPKVENIEAVEEIPPLVDNKIECEEKEEPLVPAEIVEEPIEEDKEDKMEQEELIEPTKEENTLPFEENEEQLNQPDVLALIEDNTQTEENNAVVNEDVSSSQVELKQTIPEENLEQISTVESTQKGEDLFEIKPTTEEPIPVEEITSNNEVNEEKTTDVKFKIGESVLDAEEENVKQKDIEQSVEEKKQNVEEETKSSVVATASEETLPQIEDVLTETAPVVESEENVETMLALAGLQQDSIAEMNEKPYSEKEIREMEALQMAVESITENTVKPSLENVQKEPKEENIPPKTSILEQQLKQDEVYQKYRIEKPLSVSVDEPFTEKDKPYSPKITIKPIKAPNEEVSTTSDNEAKGPLKMTITKQSDNTHSILKVYNPEEDHQEGHSEQIGEEPIPKLRIKPQNSKMSTRSSKQTYSPTSSSLSPRITIKPVVKPDSPFKITIKPESTKKSSPKIVTEQAVSPRITIKPIPKPCEESASPPTTPKLTIKPIKRHADDDAEAERSSPKITIKPVVKPSESETGPRLTIKPIKKQDDLEKTECELSPKVSIKTVIKPHESDLQQNELEEEVKERIVLKINKGNLPTPSKESKKREHPPDEDKSEKLAKIKLKLSKEGGHAHIVQETDDHTKRPRRDNGNPSDDIIHKRSKKDVHHYPTDEATKRVIEDKQLTERAKKMRVDDPYEPRLRQLSGETSEEGSIDAESKISTPMVITDDPRTPHGSDCVIVEDSLDAMGGAQSCGATPSPGGQIVTTPTSTPTPRRRGRPRKVPLEVREEFKDPDPESLTSDLPNEAMAAGPPPAGATSSRPKRSCRGQNVMATLGIKPRKPRGGGRGRGGKANMGTRPIPMKPEKEPKLSKARLKLLEKAAKDELKTVQDVSFALFNTDDKPNDGLTGYFDRKSEIKASRFEDTLDSVIRDVLSRPDAVTSDIVMVDEETRMSADTSSRAQTPAKQVIPSVDVIEESQSSGTTESGKASVSRPNKAPRLEVHQEPEGNVLSADQLAEYCWNGNGPFMLQEQVAQFLGIKSFKRKYPGMTRRTVEMQERDFIRESGLASEAMCDLGLTAVNSADVLDIMYSDFQEKYEEYCKHQRDRQAKDLINKQRALTLAASQEKTKIDITEQAVQSAAQWNAGFNKARQEERKACMDLQSLTVHYPKGNLKQLTKPKIGNYPVALVPGQFTDYYQEYTPTEINNLPLNTMCYDAVKLMPPEESCESEDGSESDSDSSTTSSDSSRSSSSLEDCKLCKPTPKKVLAK